MKTNAFLSTRCLSAAMTGFLMLAAVSCGQKDNGTGLVSVKYSQLPQGEDLMLSELVGEPEFIVLDSDTAVAYTPFATVNVSDTYISIFSIASRTPLKLFDRSTGKYLKTYGGIGRGPGEFLQISSVQIDEAGGKIWMMTYPDINKLHVYDIATGKMEDVPLAYSTDDGSWLDYSFRVDGRDRNITVAVKPEDNGCPALAWCQDYEGEVLWEIPRTYSFPEDNRAMMDTDRNVQGMLDVSYRSTNTMQDTVWLYGGGEAHPLLTVSFGQMEESEAEGYTDGNYIYSTTVLPGHIVMSVRKQGKSVMNEGVRHVSTEPLPGVIMDRRTGDVHLGGVVNDLMDGERVGIGDFVDGYAVCQYDAASFMEAGRTALESGSLSDAARARISEILSVLSEEDNDVLMVAPLK
jgi:hypothetical protein